MRKSFLPWLACAVLAAIVVPTLAWGQPVRDPQPAANAAFVVGDNFYNDASGSGPDDHSVTIAAGEKVSFTYAVSPQNNSVHNVDFSFETQPSSCVETASPEGIPLETDDKSPLPNFSQ